jgi:aryl-alcohol dehydrogenase-like predicted oxidoreductase
VQAYASLGGQDTGKKSWSQLLGTTNYVATTTPPAGKKKARGKTKEIDLLSCEPVKRLAAQLTADGGVHVTPAMILLRWAMEQGVAVIPKTVSESRLRENAGALSFAMSLEQVDGLRDELLSAVRANNADQPQNVETLTRLCWRSDPLRHLNFA